LWRILQADARLQPVEVGVENPLYTTATAPCVNLGVLVLESDSGSNLVVAELQVEAKQMKSGSILMMDLEVFVITFNWNRLH
jgi:hypothetical protein